MDRDRARVSQAKELLVAERNRARSQYSMRQSTYQDMERSSTVSVLPIYTKRKKKFLFYSKDFFFNK